MTEKLGRARGLRLAFGAAAVSGFAVFVNAYGVRAVPDATVYTTAKNLVAAAILIVAASALASRAATRAVPPAATVEPAAWRTPRRLAALVAIAVVGGSVPFVLFFEGLAAGSSTQAAFIHKTLVIWVAILAVTLLGERLRAAHVVAIAVLVAGQALLAGDLSRLRLGEGQLLVLAATLLWAGETVLAKRLLPQVGVATVALARMAGGAALLVAWVAVTGRWSTLATLDSAGWLWAGATGTILAGYVALWFSALALAPAVDVTAVLVVAAVVTGVLNAAVKGAPVTTGAATGMVLLACGAALAVFARPKPVRVEVA